MSKAIFRTAADVFGTWRDDVLTGKPPTLYPVGEGELADIQIGPGLVTLVGGAPGSGKTALTMQLMTDGLRLTNSLKVCVCNVEMPPTMLLDRQLARLSGIDLKTIRQRSFTGEHGDRLDRAFNTLESIVDRLCFVRPPFDLGNVAATADKFQADVIVLDYIQRIPPPGEHGDRRGSVDATMNYLRQFTDEGGKSVIAVAAVGRTKDTKGRSSYDGAGLNLASFRESSELEFGCDDAFIVVPDRQRTTGVTLKHLKARYAEPRDLELKFDRARQSFSSWPIGVVRPVDCNQPSAELVAMWDHVDAADDEEGVDE